MKQKIKIMKNKPDLSDEEIRSYMDFDKLLHARKHATPFIGRTKLLVAIGVVLISTGIWFYFEMSPLIPDNAVGKESSKASLSSDPSVIYSDSLASATLDSANRGPLNNRTPIHSNKLLKSEKSKLESKDPAVLLPQPNSREEKTVGDSYLEAEPQNGYPNFYEYLNNNLRYPVESMKDSIQGIETISFSINAQGKPEHIRVRQSLGKAFDEESMRVIHQMPAWKPAILNGKPVASQISIPLTFHMERVK